MVTVPAVIPVTTPVVLPIVAIAPELVNHVPPVLESDNVIVEPTQTDVGPVMGPSANVATVRSKAIIDRSSFFIRKLVLTDVKLLNKN